MAFELLSECFFSDTIIVSIFRPSGLLYSSRVWLSPNEFLTASWLWFPLILNGNDPGGEWTYQIVYKGLTYDHKFQFINPQGIETAKFQQQILILPNPVSNNLSIDILDADTQLISLNIYDLFGRVILQKDRLKDIKNDFNLDVSMLEKGIYFLKLNTSTGIQSVKFVKK